MEMEEHILPRSGLSAVKFTGELIAEAASPLPEWEKAKKSSRRWHELRLYRMESGKYVVTVGFRTRHEQESNQDTVQLCESSQDVENFLVGNDGYDPCQFLEGFPSIPKFEKHQERLENRITNDFESRVGELLAQAGFVETFE